MIIWSVTPIRRANTKAIKLFDKSDRLNRVPVLNTLTEHQFNKWSAIPPGITKENSS